MPNNELLYPIFLECCQYTEDVFWENIFENLAYGNTPFGSYISKNYICCSYKSKEFSYKIDENKSSEVLFVELYNLFSKRLGILSGKEKSKKQESFHNMENSIKNSRVKWNDIRKKSMKELLIELYVLRMKKKFDLTTHQSKHLLSFILMAIVFKNIKSEDVIYENNKITEIKGISFKHGKIIFESDIENVDVSSITQELSSQQLMSENWEKFLSNLSKTFKT